MKIFKKINSKGSVLIETAVVCMFLMTLVIGMGSVSVHMTALESQGRFAREATDAVSIKMNTAQSLNQDDVEMMTRLARDRLRVQEDDYRFFITVVRRNALDGGYVVLDRISGGGLEAQSRTRIEDTTAPGVQVNAQVIDLALGQTAIAVESFHVFKGAFGGGQNPETRYLAGFSIMEAITPPSILPPDEALDEVQ